MRRVLIVLGVLVLGLLVTLSLAGAAYTPSTDIPAGMAGKHVTVHGVPLRVWQEGSGPDVLLIHGSPGSVEDWIPIVAASGRSPPTGPRSSRSSAG